jgi:hypothetical protein
VDSIKALKVRPFLNVKYLPAIEPKGEIPITIFSFTFDNLHISAKIKLEYAADVMMLSLYLAINL